MYLSLSLDACTESRLELSPLEEDGVEPGQRKQKLLVFGLSFATAELLVLHQIVQSQDVGLQPLRRLHRRFQGAPQNRNRKLRMRATRQPQPEVRKGVAIQDVIFHNFLQTAHPVKHQVAVREEGSVSLCKTVVQNFLGAGSLALTKRTVFNVDTQRLGQLKHHRRWVHAR